MGKGGREVQRNPQKGQVVPSAMRAPALRRGRLGRGAAAAGEPRAGRGAEGIAKNPGPALTPAGRTQLYTPKTGTNNTGKESPNDKKKNTTVTRRRVSSGKQCSA